MGEADRFTHDAYYQREKIVRAFFAAEAERLAGLCHVMARRFSLGGRLLAFGVGAAATDAQHISVEFVHPVIVGKRALPAIALPNDAASSSALAAADPRGSIARHLEVIGRPEDIAVGIIHDDDPGNPVVGALESALRAGMLPVALVGSGAQDKMAAIGETYVVPSDDPFLVQEVHETLYHVLWELVHVFFEHKGLLFDGAPEEKRDVGRSGFLYPFLERAESGTDEVLDEVARSILAKAEDVIALRAASKDPDGLVETSHAVRRSLEAGAKILVLGNGGSATDAQDLVVDLVAPPAALTAWPGVSLTADAAVITAIGNDVGFDNVFARQVIAYGNTGDVVVAISTSGGSRNVVAAMEEARRRGLLTVAFAGYGGGELSKVCDRVHVIDGEYIPRIQEAQATQYHCLRRLLG